ncbi:hypothetical protein [Streptomyces sp. KL118A]|uniref:hypothetical protein n=1 Tax=Streptomyces sp. KL118A TaxID=3045153 RepID=UPI00278C7226|nr:hypothetical protein [Streptomyces sp. KL118A]
MTRSTISSRRRMAGVATAALLSLGLLTACGSESSDTDASSASSSQKAESHAKSSDNGAKGNSDLSSRAEGGESNFLQGDTTANHTFQLSVDGGTETLGGVSELKVDQPTEQSPSNKLIPGQQQTGSVTVVRGAEQAQQFTDLVNGSTQPGTASLSMLDTTGNATKQYTLQEPRVIKVDAPQTGNAQSVTIRFTNLTVG